MPDAAERKALFTCALLAGSLLMAPGERVASGICFTIGLSLFAWHTLLGRKEARNAAASARAAAPAAVTAPTGEPPAPAEAQPPPPPEAA